MDLCAFRRGQIAALPQWDSSFPHRRRFAALIVEVLESHDAVNVCSVQYEPTPVPFLKKTHLSIKPHTTVHCTDLYKAFDWKFVERSLFLDGNERHV